VLSRCEYDWTKIKINHANLHKNVSQVQCYTATPKNNNNTHNLHTYNKSQKRTAAQTIYTN